MPARGVGGGCRLLSAPLRFTTLSFTTLCFTTLCGAFVPSIGNRAPLGVHRGVVHQDDVPEPAEYGDPEE